MEDEDHEENHRALGLRGRCARHLLGRSAVSPCDPASSPQNDAPPRSLERSAFTALVVLLAAPVIAQGLWRPLCHVFGSCGSAGSVTAAALALGGAMVLLQWLRPARAQWLPLALGGLIALAAAGALSLGLPGLLTLLSVAAAAALLSQRLPPRLPPVLDGLARRHPALTFFYVVVALAAIVTTARLSVFMGDAKRVEQQVLPGLAFVETHSCLTAYVHAAALSQEGVANLYAERWWHGAHGLPPAPAGVKSAYQPFLLDYYAYPPPFLLIMAPLAPLSGDFPAQRALWFGLNGLLLAIGLWVVARWIDGPRAHRALLLAPLFFGSLPILVTLQVGNFQIAVVVLSVLAMLAFERDRPALGGALLAFTILSKLSPGILGIFLLMQRRFRCAAWTAGFGVLYLLLSMLSIGVDPMTSFLTYTLSRISSGQAFAFMDDDPFSILTNMGPFGLPFKLPLLGITLRDPWALARHLGHAHTVVLIVLALVAGRRQGDRRTQALTWLSLLVLAALQSPFAPGYVTIGLLWAVTLLTMEVRSLRGGAALLLLWLGLTIALPTTALPVLAVYSVLQSALTIAAPIWLLVRKPA